MKKHGIAVFDARLSATASACLLLSLAAGCESTDGAPAPDGGSASANDGGAEEDGASAVVEAGGGVDGRDAAGGGGIGDGSAFDAESGDDGAALGTTLAVNLRTAAGFAILAESAISTVPTSAVTGNLGISPMAATFITGFSLTAAASNVFSTSPQVTGKVYAADYAVPTPSNLTTAIGDMQLAFTDAAGRAPKVTELGAGNVGGMTLPPGVYKWGTGLLIPTDVTLTGSATDVWIFQIAQNLTVSSAAKVTLAGGALPENVFWEVAGSVDLGTTAHVEGTILSKTSIALETGASITGRLMAQTAVSIDGSVVVQP